MLITSMLTLLASVFPILIIMIMLLMSIKKNNDREKSSPFECGFDPKSSARIPFSLRFFLLAVMFLVFDIEIALLLPTPLTTTNNIWNSMMSLYLFLIIMIIGLLHEWREGSLNWQM